jgi:hypothetical protein
VNAVSPGGRSQVKTLCPTHAMEHDTSGLDKYQRGTPTT